MERRIRPAALRAQVVAAAALIQSPSGAETLGPVADAETLPRNQRRRLSAFDLSVTRCVVGVSVADEEPPIVFASRYGNMAVTMGLLNSICEFDLLSPAAFSISVHNAPTALASQITGNHGGHTAVAAGASTFAAGLTEAFMRLAEGAPSVIAVYADAPLPDVYGEFDEGPAGVSVSLAMRLAAAERAGSAHDVASGRAGALALARAVIPGGGALNGFHSRRPRR